jgi:hypothetical protein
MNETQQSLLLRAQNGEQDAWKDLTDLYRPLILGWLQRQGVPARDLDDLSQEVLLSVVKHLPRFKHCYYGKGIEDDLSLGSGPQQTQYPFGTVAMYGPDDKTTTKIAAGVILHVGAEPIMKRWVATAPDRGG